MTQLLRRGRQAARVGPWRGAEGSALLAPTPGPPDRISAPFLRWCCDQLAERGFSQVVSPALLPADTGAYDEAGFSLLEELHLLSRDLRSPLPAPGGPGRIRRVRRSDLETVVAIDHDAFHPFWRFDGVALAEARLITPRSRFRLAVVDGRAAGYSLTGLGQEQGYLQRLAIVRTGQRRGIGSSLVADALRWLARRRAERVLVNTQIGNDAALSLYRAMGFRLEDARLRVLARSLP